jgi:hypothetical protein
VARPEEARRLGRSSRRKTVAPFQIQCLAKQRK